MDDIRDLIAEAEVRLSNAEIPVQQFCETAGISRATWQRWKAGVTVPSVVTWNRVALALPSSQAA